MAKTLLKVLLVVVLLSQTYSLRVAVDKSAHQKTIHEDFSEVSGLNKVTFFSTQGLGFENNAESGVSDQMKQDFIDVINSASSFYKDDLQANLLYIKENLDNRFGVESQAFFVFIQTERTNSASITSLTPDLVKISLSNVNKAHPEWSYLIYRYNGPNDTRYPFLQYPQTGEGITDDGRSFIDNAIQQLENSADFQYCCASKYLLQLFDNIKNNFNINLNLVCGQKGETAAIVNADKEFWGTFRGNCEYTLYSQGDL